MQSFLQYRRFKAAAIEQLERDRAKLRNANRENKERHDEEKSPAPSDDSKVDLEKGTTAQIHAGTSLANTKDVPYGVHPGEIDPNIGPPLKQEEEQTMQENQRPEDYEEASVEDEEEDDLDNDDDYEMTQQRTTLSRVSTQRSTGSALGNVLTGVNIRKRSTRDGGEGNVFVVGYEGPDDPLDPHNWSYTKRIPCTLLIASIGCVVGLASAIDSSAIVPAAAEFQISETQGFSILGGEK